MCIYIYIYIYIYYKYQKGGARNLKYEAQIETFGVPFVSRHCHMFFVVLPWYPINPEN